MLRHMKLECGHPPTYRCMFCPHLSKRMKCAKCGKCYRYKRSLNRHLKYECGVPPQFSCPHCVYITKHKSSLMLHIGNIHGGYVMAPKYLNEEESILLKCNKCGKCYRHQTSLHRHIKYECGVPPQFFCPHCQYKTRHRSSLKLHLANTIPPNNQDRLKNFNKYMCPNCFKSYRHVESLYRHQRYECGKEPHRKQFICNVCKRGYQHTSTLKRHLKYECGKLPQFNCPYCPMAKYHKQELKLHIFSKHRDTIN
ncbi:hypothetical protein AAG570_013849 [Ranatra chinensis]|uniref:C2H2-type domain-containing protein n=1 Tax=Ranatra chinensis TaxID=642074 RepID=A0ABD0YDE0_9HEMI